MLQEMFSCLKNSVLRKRGVGLSEGEGERKEKDNKLPQERAP